jgi:anti-sigma regulatory factor (Ser/Thr protein kinase)
LEYLTLKAGMKFWMQSGAREERVPLAGTLAHQALLYGTVEEFVRPAASLVREGADRGEPTLVAVRERNLRALREELGADAGEAELLSTRSWYENPARTRAKAAAWVAGRAGAGRVRLIGEPPWPLSSEAGVREWARHEAVTNVEMAGLPVTLICPYSREELPPKVLDHAVRTHPELCGGDGVSASPEFTDPHAFCSSLGGEAPRQGSPLAQMEFGPGDLGRLRRLVELEGGLAGLHRTRLSDLVVAVNEVATNAMLHGGAPAVLRIWREAAELVCEVQDAGPGIDDPLAGQLRPDPRSIGGRGLWITRMIADATEIGSGPEGTTVAIHTSLH